ncbi:hypothetical protein EHS13_30125 [Paenibacillus psychroresistens]|uniref:Uncharacterized protein n=1 Tax=Paenibacillus psychroresistens TaxID=1778678 RepID=A0A6B8RTE6_9BACL|nr:hypothetical protein [Paenibacillus psychroresistens]QGQ98835.1 hypothetical protein EHS13_30125 [Paenibacillus psychroresistens]
MIVVSKIRYLPITINTLVLYKDEHFYYLSRDVYDQALLLMNNYPILKNLSDIFEGSKMNDSTVSWFFEKAPHPINILAPYLFLVNGPVEQDIELCCGVLNAITNMLNVRSFINKPSEIRKSVSFSLLIKEEYKIEWNRFFLSALPYESQNDINDADQSESVYSQVDSSLSELDFTFNKKNEKQELLSLLEGGGLKKEDLKGVGLPKTSSQSERRTIKNLLE